MEPSALHRIRQLTAFLEANQNGVVIDADTHATDLTLCPNRDPGYYHGRPLSGEELIAEMDAVQVTMANVWQNPSSTPYPGDEDGNTEALLAANRYILSCAVTHPNRFIASGWTDPRACGVANACRIAEICVREFGFLMVKMNPAQNRYPIDSPEVLTVLDRIVELGAIPVFHYGADTPYTPASGLETIAQRLGTHPMAAVHMGGGGAGYVEADNLYRKSIALGLRYPNIRFIFSATRDTYIEEAIIAYQLAGPEFTRNLLCGSDAPYGRMSWNFGGFRAMFASLLDGARHPDPRVRRHPSLVTEQDVAGYLGSNFAQLTLQGYRHLLAQQAAGA
jgi:predicted TIM-barrel fold metal-dependent hydrolase